MNNEEVDEYFNEIDKQQEIKDALVRLAWIGERLEAAEERLLQLQQEVERG